MYSSTCKGDPTCFNYDRVLVYFTHNRSNIVYIETNLIYTRKAQHVNVFVHQVPMYYRIYPKHMHETFTSYKNI